MDHRVFFFYYARLQLQNDQLLKKRSYKIWFFFLCCLLYLNSKSFCPNLGHTINRLYKLEANVQGSIKSRTCWLDSNFNRRHRISFYLSDRTQLWIYTFKAVKRSNDPSLYCHAVGSIAIFLNPGHICKHSKLPPF